MTLKERLKRSPEEKKRRYQQAVKPFVEKNFKNGVVSAENYIGTNDSPTAGLTKENFARSTEGYAANNDGTYRYRVTRELGIADQIDQNPVYAAKDRMQYYLIDNPNAFDSPRELKTANDYWGQIYTVMSKDSVQGNALAEQAKYFSTQYGNPLYNPYQASTLSKDIKNLFGLESFSKEWVAENYNLLNALELTDAGNPKAPSNKSTPEQILAYHYSKILDAEANTLKAEQELADLKAQISSKVANAKLYKTGQSVDDIYKSLEMKDYTTLKAMEDSKLKAQPYTLTRAVNYNDDVVYAMIQAAMDADDSDISGITDFTQAGAAYSNNKYVDAQEKRAQLYQKFYEDERERYRQEQDAVLTGDTSVQDKYKARDIAQPETNAWNSGAFNRVSEPKEPGVKNNEPVKASSWADVDFANPNNVNLSAKAPEVSVGAVPRNNANSKPNTATSPVQTITERPGMATMPGMERYQMVPYMDQKEVEEYNRIFDSEGLNAADEYYYSIAETLNKRAADQKIKELSGNRPAQVMYGFINGLVSTGEGWAQMLSSDVRPDSVSSIVSQAIKEESGDVADTLYDVTSSVGAMAPSILMSIISGNVGTLLGMGVKAASTLGQVAAGVSTLFSSGGNAYNEVMKSGEYSVGQAKSYATLVGASEALLSYALSGISALGGKLWGKVGATKIAGNVAQTIKHTDNVFLRIAGKGLLPAVEEGTEEWIQAAIEPVLKNAILGTDEDMNPFSENALYSAFLGAITGGLLESGPSAIKAGVEVRNEREIGRDIIETGKRDRLIQAAKQSNNADVRQAAEALEAGTVRASEGMIGQLAIEYKDAGGDISFLTEPIEPEVQPTVESITTDYDSAQALTRAMRGEVTESDLDLLEKSLSIPNHEDTVNEISAAAKELKAVQKTVENKESQLQHLQNDMLSAHDKLDRAKAALSEHQRGIVLMQQGETVESVLIEKQSLESQIDSLMDEAERVSEAGLEPTDQMQKAESLNAQLDAVNIKYNQLIASGREATVFHGQITNSQKAYNAAERNYSVAEDEYYAMQPIYNAALDNFRDRVAKAVNTAFGSNALGMLGVSENKSSGTVDMNAPEEPDMSNYYEVYNQLNQEDKAEADYAQNIIQSDMEYKNGSIPEDIKESVKADLRSRRLALTDTQQQEIASITDTYGDFRKNMMGKITLATDGASLDSVWSELSDAYPTLFPANTSEGEQIRILANTLNELYPNTAKNQGVQYSLSDHTLPTNQQTEPQKKRWGKALTAQEVIRKASSRFNLPIRSGIEASMDGVPGQARAYYNQQAAAARIPGDIANIAHEIGHALDARHGFSFDHADMAQQMVENLPENYASLYPAEQLRREAVGDMVYNYVIYGEDAAINFGGQGFYTFWGMLTRSEQRALRSMHSDVRRYINQSADETGTRAVTQTKADTDARTAKAKVRDTARNFVGNYLDNMEAAIRLDRLAAKGQDGGFLTQDKHVETALATARRAESIASAQLTQALSTPSGEVIGDSFESCVEGVSASEMVELSKYMAYMRALDWMDKGRNVLDPKVTRDYMTTYCLDIQDKHQNISQAAEKIWAWYKQFGQAWLVNTGRMSQSEFDTLWTTDHHYVPFRRVIDYRNSSGASFAQGVESLDTGIYAVEGSGSRRDMYDPLTSLMQNVANITQSTLRNEVGKTILWQIRNSNNLEGMVTEVPASQVQEQAVQSALESDNGYELLAQMENQVLTRPDGTNIFGIVDEGGRRSWIQVNDPQLLALMQNPDPKNTNKFLQGVAKVTRIANASVTTVSLPFSVANLVSDVGSAFRASPSANPFTFMVDELRSLADVARKDNHSNEYMEWVALGGLGDNVYSTAGLEGTSGRDVATRYFDKRPENAKEFFQKMGAAWETVATKLSTISENATRLTSYKQGKRAALAEGQSQQSARIAGARLSREGTTDFNRTGRSLVGISTIFRFAGASINGNVQAIRSITDSSTAVTSNNMKNRRLKVALGVLSRSAAVALLTSFFMDDDEKEQFRHMDPTAKYSGLCIPWSAVSGVKGDIKVIPYPKDVLSDIMSIGAAIADGSLNGGLWDDIKGLGDCIVESLNPFSSPIWAPIWEATTNTTWYGGNIIPGNLERKSYNIFKYDEDTSAIARFAATGLYNLTKGAYDISPMTIDYILEQYGGGVYDAVVGIEEGITSVINGRNVPDAVIRGGQELLNSIRDRFTRNAITVSDVSETYYSDTKLIDSIISTIEDGDMPPDLAQGLTASQVGEAYTAANDLYDNQIKPLNEKIAKLYDEMDLVAADTSLSMAEQERETSEIRKEIYDLQLSGIALVDNYRLQYCGDSYSAFTTPRADATANKAYAAFNNESLPQGIRDQADGKILTKMRSFYERDTNKTTFTPKYPPSFVDNDNVLTAWESVDSQTKTAMERAWTDAYMTELANNGFATVSDYDTAKSLASKATSKANAAAKEIYSIKYGFKE